MEVVRGLDGVLDAVVGQIVFCDGAMVFRVFIQGVVTSDPLGSSFDLDEIGGTWGAFSGDAEGSKKAWVVFLSAVFWVVFKIKALGTLCVEDGRGWALTFRMDTNGLFAFVFWALAVALSAVVGVILYIDTLTVAKEVVVFSTFALIRYSGRGLFVFVDFLGIEFPALCVSGASRVAVAAVHVRFCIDTDEAAFSASDIVADFVMGCVVVGDGCEAVVDFRVVACLAHVVDRRLVVAIEFGGEVLSASCQAKRHGGKVESEVHNCAVI